MPRHIIKAGADGELVRATYDFMPNSERPIAAATRARYAESVKHKAYAFLTAYRETRVITPALKRVQLHDDTFRRLRERDAEFDAKYLEIQQFIHDNPKCPLCGYVGDVDKARKEAE